MKRHLLGAIAFLILEATEVKAFELKHMNAEEADVIYKSTDYPRSVFVVEAYFKNCPACNSNAFRMNDLRDHYRRENEDGTFSYSPEVQILDVSRDCRNSDYSAWVSRHKPNHPVLNDCNSSTLLGDLGTSSYPTTYVLDCKLNVIKKHVGGMSDREYVRFVELINDLIVKIPETCDTEQD